MQIALRGLTQIIRTSGGVGDILKGQVRDCAAGAQTLFLPDRHETSHMSLIRPGDARDSRY